MHALISLSSIIFVIVNISTWLINVFRIIYVYYSLSLFDLYYYHCYYYYSNQLPYFQLSSCIVYTYLYSHLTLRVSSYTF